MYFHLWNIRTCSQNQIYPAIKYKLTSLIAVKLIQMMAKGKRMRTMVYIPSCHPAGDECRVGVSQNAAGMSLNLVLISSFFSNSSTISNFLKPNFDFSFSDA